MYDDEPSGINWFMYYDIVCKVGFLCNDGEPNIIGILLVFILFIGSVFLFVGMFGLITIPISIFFHYFTFKNINILWKKGSSIVKKLFKRE